MTEGLSVRGLRSSYGDTQILRGVDVLVERGRILALLGPSGCGKTTLLRCVAGLEHPDAGQVTADAVPLDGLAPQRRRIGMVFQDWALFPHLSVGDNVAYGLPRRDRAGGRVSEALALVGLTDSFERDPATLSGGQQQRVALARAIAPRPRLLLLDEPFSNLDATLREEIRGEVHQLLLDLGITTVFVTHDQTEAFVIGDHVAVMRDGRVRQQGSPEEIYESPRDPWVATFVGDANLLSGRPVHGQPLRDGKGLLATPVGQIEVGVDGRGQHRADAVSRYQVLIRPEALAIAAPASAPREGVAGRVVRTSYHGHETVYLVDIGEGILVRVRSSGSPRARRSDTVAVTNRGGTARAWPVTQPPESGTVTTSPHPATAAIDTAKLGG